MGNRTAYIQPTLSAIQLEKDFFDYNIFEKVQQYGPLTDGTIPFTLSNSEINKLNAGNQYVRIVKSDYGYIDVKVRLSADMIVNWLVYRILNNKDLKFTCNSTSIDKHMEVIQTKLNKLGYTLVS